MMAGLAHLFASGHVADAVLGLMLLEALFLFHRHRRHGRGPAPLDLVAMLGAGACLVLALRLALTEAAWGAIAASLAAAGVLHVIDLVRRSKE